MPHRGGGYQREQADVQRGVTYRDPAEKLEAMGINETERNLANKIGRGGFTTTFFVRCLIAAGCTVLRLEDA